MPDLWYSGLRVTGERPLNGDDRAAIARLRRDRRLRSVASIVAPLLVAAVGCFGSNDLLRLTWFAAAMLAMLLKPWRRLPAWERQVSRLDDDEAGGAVLLCQGFGVELLFALDEEQRLQPRLLVRGPRDEPLAVEVLPHSGAILRVNGKAVRDWNVMQRGTTAPKSAHAIAAASFVSEDSGVGSRALAPEEIEELLRHAPAPTPVDRLLAAACGALAAVSWWHAVATRSATLLLPIVASMVAVWAIVRTVRRWRLHRRFARDLAYGRVIIVRPQVEGGPPLEYLPFSRWLWTANHVPAPWRRLPLARGTWVRRG